MKFIKKIGFLVLAILIAVILYGVYGVFINPKSPKGNVLFKNENIEMEVSYSRPYKRERLIFGNVNEGALVPFGKYWRLGANFATSFKVNTGWETLPGYGYLWWLPPEGYLAFGYGGQFIAVLPDQNLVVGTHSNIYSTLTYQEQVLDYIYNGIVPLFGND